MAKIVRPDFGNTKLSQDALKYSFDGYIKNADLDNKAKPDDVVKMDYSERTINFGIFDKAKVTSSDYEYRNDFIKEYKMTGAHQALSFTSAIRGFIERHITAKLKGAMETVEGKIHSLLERLGISKDDRNKDDIGLKDYTPDKDKATPSDATPSDATPSDPAPSDAEKEETTTKPNEEIEIPHEAAGSDLEKETTTKPESTTEPETTEKPTEPETKPEPTTEATTEPTTAPVVIKPGQNAELTQTLINKKDELVVGKGVNNNVRTDCNTYSVGGNTNDNHSLSDRQLSPKEREMLIYMAYHEAGRTGDPVQATAAISAFMNGWESNPSMSFNEYMRYACSRWSGVKKDGVFIYDEFGNMSNSLKNGSYTYNDITNLSLYKEMKKNGYYDIMGDCVDNVLSGTRNNNATQWQGGYHNKNGQLVNQFHNPA